MFQFIRKKHFRSPSLIPDQSNEADTCFCVNRIPPKKDILLLFSRFIILILQEIIAMKFGLCLLLFAIGVRQVNIEPFQKGYFYSNDGKRTDGLIKFHRATFSVFGSKKSHIEFKESEDSPSKKLTADNISAFVIGNDSFTIVYNIKINSISGKYVRDFAKVVATGKVNLYLHMSSSSDGRNGYDNDRYVLSKDGKTFLGIWNPKDQREEIAEFFSDNTEIKTRILHKEFDKSIPELVKVYNGN